MPTCMRWHFLTRARGSATVYTRTTHLFKMAYQHFHLNSKIQNRMHTAMQTEEHNAATTKVHTPLGGSVVGQPQSACALLSRGTPPPLQGVLLVDCWVPVLGAPFWCERLEEKVATSFLLVLRGGRAPCSRGGRWVG